MTNIMIVDVNTTTSYRIKKLLESVPVEVHTTSTVHETINRMNNPQMSIDIAVVDVKLGSEDGFDLISRIKDMNPNLLIIIITGLNTRKSFVQGIKVGAVDYILKPYDDEYLKFKLLNHISAVENSKTIPDYSPKHVDNVIYSAVKKAVREGYEMLMGLIIIYHKKFDGNEGVNIKDMAILRTLNAHIGETLSSEDQMINQSANGILLLLPKRTEQLKDTVSNYYKKLCEEFIHSRQIEDTYIALEFISLPTEVNPNQNALSVLAQKIEKKML